MTPPVDLASLRRRLKSRGLGLIQYDTGPVHSYPYDSPWLVDERFNELYEAVKLHTLVDRVRCFSLYQLAHQIRKIEGDVLEIGVWRGGTAGILSSVVPGKTVFLADTFRGVVKAGNWEHYKNSAHSDTSRQTVNALLERLGVRNCQILEGVFPDETGALVADRNWSLVHIDVDVYLSAKDALNAVWGAVSPGGIVVFDDYGFQSACSGILQVVEEVKDDADKLFIHNLNGHAYLVKRG